MTRSRAGGRGREITCSVAASVTESFIKDLVFYEPHQMVLAPVDLLGGLATRSYR